MHTLIFSFPHDSAPGGGERYAERLVEGLAPRNHRFTLVSSSRALLGVFMRRGWASKPFWGGIEPVSKFSILLFPLTLPLFLPMQVAILSWYRLRGVRALICLSLTDKLLATVPARLLGLRVIWVEHLVPGRSLTLNPYRALYALYSRFAKVVCVSEAVADGIVSLGVPRRRIEVIYPGLAPDAAPIEAAADAPIIGAVTRLSAEKNIDLLVRAFARAAARVPEARLRICGDGPERAALESLVVRLNLSVRTEFCGYVEEESRLYGGLRALAMPSALEAFGMAALEAMSHGLPVAATHVGGLPELVIDGETGMLVPPGDEVGLADALLALLTDRELARRLGEAGRRRAFASFSSENMIAAWQRLLDPHVPCA